MIRYKIYNSNKDFCFYKSFNSLFLSKRFEHSILNIPYLHIIYRIYED